MWGGTNCHPQTPFFWDEWQELATWGASAHQASGKDPQETHLGEDKVARPGEGVFLE